MLPTPSLTSSKSPVKKIRVIKRRFWFLVQCTVHTTVQLLYWLLSVKETHHTMIPLSVRPGLNAVWWLPWQLQMICFANDLFKKLCMTILGSSVTNYKSDYLLPFKSGGGGCKRSRYWLVSLVNHGLYPFKVALRHILLPLIGVSCILFSLTLVVCCLQEKTLCRQKNLSRSSTELLITWPLLQLLL